MTRDFFSESSRKLILKKFNANHEREYSSVPEPVR